MLSITTKSQYGLIALLDMAEHYGKNLVQISDVVRRRSIPKNYLEQILNRLQKTGIVKSVRGNKGGYELGAHPDDISLKRIVESLEGEINLRNNRVCAALDEILEKIEHSVSIQLDVPLSQLMERQKVLEQQIIFNI
ncbi:MAG: Rrf2 family transcriptional regulator [Fibrobacter sp.]|nr:Rrf2 family transcriptional regulator [Fibrobacter sp.]